MRIVIKVGTSTLAHPTGRLNIQRIELLCKVMSDLKNAGHQIILVSSGAIAMGFGKLNLPERPKDVPTKQASAAVGQCELMYTYDKLFTEYNHTVAQLLITRPDIAGGRTAAGEFPRDLGAAVGTGGRCPSSTKTTPSPPRRSASGTTILCPPWWRPASGRIC